MLKNLNELAKKIHKNAVAKGFWEPEREGEHIVMICSELYELLDAIRKNRKCKENSYIKFGIWSDVNVYTEDIKYFEENIKGTIEDECADIVIRCLDYLQKHNQEKNIELELFKMSSIFFKEDKKKIKELYKNECEFIYDLNTVIIQHDIHNYMSLFFVVIGINKYCEENNIDLQTYIELKMKYNKTRPRLHGNKF